MGYYDEFDEVLNDKDKKKKKKHSALLDSLKEMEDSDYSLPGYSSYEPEKSAPVYKEEKVPSFDSDLFAADRKKGKKKKKNKDYDPDAWFNDMVSSDVAVKINKKARMNRDIFDVIEGGGKKKKKKKKKGEVELVDYKKEFEPEVALLKNLLVDQTKFTDSLQREYDSITSHKSSSRGISKQMAELIENINSARGLSLQLIKEHVNVKKLVSDLSLKQKKELGGSLAEDGNIADFANNYMKQLLNNRSDIMGGLGDETISDYTDEEMFSSISSSLSGDESMDRPEEIDKYLQYENRNVKIYVQVYGEDYENYEFVAKDEDGIVIDDYPMPNRTNMSFNTSTMIATDAYGQKYIIIKA